MATWNDHVHLARWADVFLIAPLSANTLSKMGHGQCDNLLLGLLPQRHLPGIS